jgi:hypothetical protein
VKGQPSPNPGGRPKKVKTIYEIVADKQVPNDPQKRAMLELAVEGQFKAAAKGNTKAAREIADRLDGPVGVRVSGPDSGPIPVNLDYRERLQSLVRRVADRLADDVEYLREAPPISINLNREIA